MRTIKTFGNGGLETATVRSILAPEVDRMARPALVHFVPGATRLWSCVVVAVQRPLSFRFLHNGRPVMRKTMWSMFGLLIALSCVALLWAADTKPDQAKAEKQQAGRPLSTALAAKDFDKALSLLEEMGNAKDATCEEKFTALYYQFDIQPSRSTTRQACPLAKKISEAMGGCRSRSTTSPGRSSTRPACKTAIWTWPGVRQEGGRDLQE